MKKNMSELHFEILEGLKPFSKEVVLARGTALSLQITHRESYDFDLFVERPIKKGLLRKITDLFGNNIRLLVDTADELSFLTPQKLKISFVYFPFRSLYEAIKTKPLSIRHWKDIASDKAYVIGRRGEYRDYVDIFFCLQKGFSFRKIIQDAKKKFKGSFSEKLFLSQLVYFDDIKDSTVDFIDRKYSPKEIQNSLEKTVSNYIKLKI